MITVYSLSAFRPNLVGLIRDVRVTWALEELGIAYQRKVMDPLKKEHKTPEYLAIHPFGKVPAIQDGDFMLFESSAICSYLGDKASKLLPSPATRARALYDQWMSYSISTLEPQCGKVFGYDFFTDKDATTDRLRAEALALVTGQFQVLDGVITKNGYLLGDGFSLADLTLSSVIRFVMHTEVTVNYPALQAYLTRNFERPAFLRAIKNNG